MENMSWGTIIVTLVVSLLGSSGVWAFLQMRFDKKDVKAQMLLGLGHDRIVYLGLKYIEQGWISQDEYENLNDYLYEPYKKMGGNGSAKRVMEQVDKLPTHPPKEDKSETK